MELILVYNANSGVANKLWDAMHKAVSPSTYACELCSLTHHSVGARSQWKSFLKEKKIPTKVMYKDQFEAIYQKSFEFPAVFLYDKSNFTCILDKKAMSELNELEDFLVLLKSRLPETDKK